MQRLHVFAVPLCLPAGQLAPVLAVPVGPFQQRVIDVGDVLHVDDGVPARGVGWCGGFRGSWSFWGFWGFWGRVEPGPD